MYTIQKDWKSFNISLRDLDAKWRIDYPEDGSHTDGLIYHGSSGNSKFELHFNQEPSSTEKTNIDDYWDGVGKDTAPIVSGTDLAMTLDVDPDYTMKVGDSLIVGSETRTIDGVTDQQTFTIDTAFTADPSSDACTICSPEVDGYFTQDQLMDSRKQMKEGITTNANWSDHSTQQKKTLSGTDLTLSDDRQIMLDFPPTA